MNKKTDSKKHNKSKNVSNAFFAKSKTKSPVKKHPSARQPVKLNAHHQKPRSSPISRNEDALRKLRRMVSANFFNDVNSYLRSGDTFNYAICNFFKGAAVPSEHPWRHHYVLHTINGGDGGNRFRGEVYIPLPNGMFFQFFYDIHRHRTAS